MTVSHENMPSAAVPLRGSMVVYAAGLRESGKERFRVLLPDRPGGVVDIIDNASVVNVVPPE